MRFQENNLVKLLLPRIKNGAYVKKLDDKQNKGTYSVSVFINKDTAVCFDYFGIEYTSQEVLTHTIFRIQDHDSSMCGFYCMAFIEYMLARKNLLDYPNSFSPNKKKRR